MTFCSTNSFHPLWVEGRKQFFLSKHASICLPEWASSVGSSYLEAVNALKNLGFDSVILGSFARSETVFGVSLKTCFKEIREEGISIGIKPTFHIDAIAEIFALSPLDSKFKEWIRAEIQNFFKVLPSFDYLVYESLALIFDEMGLNEDDEHLKSELARFEIALLEEIIQGRCGLIYIVPGEEAEGQKSFLKEIALEAYPRTWITFSSRRGNPFMDHLDIHPFLTKTTPAEVAGLQFASLVNIGGILQGGGLWPTVALDLVHAIYPSLINLKIIPLPCVHGLPLPGSFLEASLLISSKGVKGSRFPEQDLYLWLKRSHQESGIEALMQKLKEIRSICIHLSQMRALLFEKSRDRVSAEDTKVLALCILYRLKALLKDSENEAFKRNPSFKDYLYFFLRDAKRLVLHFIQSFNVATHESLEEDSGHPGFWTEFVPGAGSGLRSLGKVSLLKTPALEQGCPKMESIYKDAGWR